VKSGDVTGPESNILLESAVATRKVIMVDDFPGDFLQSGAATKDSKASLAAAS